MQTFTLLPMGLPARVYRSTMPFSQHYDPDGEVYQAYHDHQVTAIVMLTSDQEARENTGRDLRARYLEDGFQLIHLPIEDFSVPDPDQLQTAVEEAARQLQAGSNLAIHCHAGLGRTGMFAACLARKMLGMTAAEATAWVRENIPDAVENDMQALMVENFQP